MNKNAANGAAQAFRSTFTLLMEDYQGSHTHALTTNPQIGSLPYCEWPSSSINCTSAPETPSHMNLILVVSRQIRSSPCVGTFSAYGQRSTIPSSPSWFFRSPIRWLWPLAFRKEVEEWTQRRIELNRLRNSGLRSLDLLRCSGYRGCS